LLQVGALAIGSSAFFLALFVLLRPLPSRSLATHVPVPDRPQPRGITLASAAPPTTDAPRPLRRPARTRVTYQLASVEASAAAPSATERRRNVLSRFFRTLARSVQPGSSKIPSS
jgi:hypothetical protein